MTALSDSRAFLDEALVECPRCSQRAVVRSAFEAPRLTCSHCGYIRDGDAETPRLTWWSVRQDGHEPSFGLRLWLADECCGGNLLWALNEAHLDYLERFIASKSRDRDFPSPPGNRGLAYKLPKWMQLASARDELLHTIGRLRRRLG